MENNEPKPEVEKFTKCAYCNTKVPLGKKEEHDTGCPVRPKNAQAHEKDIIN